MPFTILIESLMRAFIKIISRSGGYFELKWLIDILYTKSIYVFVDIDDGELLSNVT